MEGAHSSAPPPAFARRIRYPSAPQHPFGRPPSLSPPSFGEPINAAAPMTIPGSQKDPLAPPPLPPPTDPILEARSPNCNAGYPHQQSDDSSTRPVSPRTTLCRDRQDSRASEGESRMRVARRESSTSTFRSPHSIDTFGTDEGYSSLSGAALSQSVSRPFLQSLHRSSFLGHDLETS